MARTILENRFDFLGEPALPRLAWLCWEGLATLRVDFVRDFAVVHVVTLG